MQIQFKKRPAESAANAVSEHLYLVPQAEQDRLQRGLAVLAVESGPGAFIAGAAPWTTIVVQADPTLDDMLAALFLEMRIGGESIAPSGLEFARYAGLCREGFRPTKIPLEHSLEGIFLAIRQDTAGDLSDEVAATAFLRQWQPMARRIREAMEQRCDPFTTSLFESGAAFARQRAYLLHDQQVYRQDVARGEHWIVSLPSGPPKASALILREPHSALWKYWARADDQAPGGESYLLLGVRQGRGNWVFSTDPVQRLSLKSLAEVLQQAERVAGTKRKRSKSPPPPDDPWFDGKPFQYTLTASPKLGTLLSDEQVLKIARRWAHAQPVVDASPRRRLMWGAFACVSGSLLLGLIAWGDGKVPENPRPFSPSIPAAHGATAVAGDAKSPARLFMMAVGISEYADPSFNPGVANARNDARDLALTFRERTAGLYRNLTTKELLNSAATKDELIEALGRFYPHDVSSRDVAVISLAGHGVVDDRGNYFFLPQDFDPTKQPATSAVSWDDIRREIEHLPCTVVLMIDTCRSGRVTRAGLRHAQRRDVEASTSKVVQAFGESGRSVVIIAASLGDQDALEHPDWGHGALTLATLECLRGERLESQVDHPPLPQATDRDGVITLHELSYYVAERVKAITGGSQVVIVNHSGDLSLDQIRFAPSKRPSPK